jgi:hypothetical protein
MPYFLSIFSQCSCVKELVSTWDFLGAEGENAIHFYKGARPDIGIRAVIRSLR